MQNSPHIQHGYPRRDKLFISLALESSTRFCQRCVLVSRGSRRGSGLFPSALDFRRVMGKTLQPWILKERGERKDPRGFLFSRRPTLDDFGRQQSSWESQLQRNDEAVSSAGWGTARLPPQARAVRNSQLNGYPASLGILPSTLTTFIPGLTSCAFTRATAPG